jgi:transposase-like protein
LAEEEGAMKCPKCGREMELEEKDTSSGRDMRTYYCRPCKERVDVDNGVALWKVLSDARKEK